MMPDRFNNALKHFYRKQYYKIDYPENYSINGFVNGQINVQLSLSDRNQDIINKPEEIINLLNGNNVSLMRSNIYGDGLKSTVDDFTVIIKSHIIEPMNIILIIQMILL
ncbi:clostridial neurotoxin zinc protease family protein (plasmid) [Clostridium botulinum]|nr:clostridial neurotoxin zinc protease family protein [Clostridium botulinum]